VSLRLCPYGGQEKIIEGKSMSMLKFFCCLGVLMVKVNLGFHKLCGIKFMFVSGV
jgi:hypothetical protein